ncbi:hypothetical protein EGJ86_19460 [Pseudomonas sp. o96-267]|uniref:type IVB secretion system protein IcmW n=1 Tax=Pseudomonas sp. o96-267 TaxID=2479853 RepID=UPI000F775239|nr:MULTISPECIES: hypothetical protein [Pseudomonas]MDH0959057.1 hypothetical protein [Pseudomonas chengduensis]MDV5863636.1 hypothetical protein [Pseudomonas mendocina]RRV31751.1 hypothetical protein EGJ86_19460 [Pseudomonas sp. o96-267]
MAQALLDSASVQAHWDEVSAPLARLLRLMDSREPWALKPDAEFIGLLDRFIERIEQPEFVLLLERGENALRLAEVFSVLHSSRFMRLIELCDRNQPGVVSRLLFAMGQLGGGSEIFAQLLYERLLAVHRCELLGQVISVERCQRIVDDIKLLQEVAQ